jgi:transcriptional regulator
VPPEHARAHLDALTARFENGLEDAWSTGRLDPARLEQLMRAIVVIEMLVESVEGKFKLNQHKNDADHVAIAQALGCQDDPSARTIAERMVALRPHLLYEGAAETAPAEEGDL